MTRALALAVALAACSRRAPLTSCDDDLRGVYVAGEASGSGERWMVLDDGPTLEAYPLFPDVDRGAAAGAAGLELAPRMLDLARHEHALAGTVHRRYLRRADRCDAEVPVHVTRCAGDTLDLVLADPTPPLGFAPCRWPGPAPSRVVHWRRD